MTSDERTPAPVVTVHERRHGGLLVDVPDPFGAVHHFEQPGRAAPDVHRTVLVGDSTIHGLFLWPHTTIGAFLEHLLRARLGAGHEVLTLAAPAIALDDSSALVAWLRGDAEQARRLDRRAWGFDEDHRAASDRTLAIVQAVAAAHGARVVELVEVMERAPVDGERPLFVDYAHPTAYGQYLFARELAEAHACALDAERVGDWPSFAEACAALGVPREVVEHGDRARAVTLVLAAVGADDPTQRLAEARALLVGLDLDAVEHPMLLAADLVLALHEGDAVRARRRATALLERDATLHAGVLATLRAAPAWASRVSSAGLALD